MNGGSLFSGIEGLGLGLERGAGIEPIWLCENDADCRRILGARFPGVPIYEDVREVGPDTPRVAVLHGGFPCQDISVAGAGAGIAEGTRSGLWFEMARAVRVLRPRHVVVENVAALLTRGLGTVLADLAEAGYDATWTCLRASDVGAPHRRERLFLVATDAERERRDGCRGRNSDASAGGRTDGRALASGPSASPPDSGGERGEPRSGWRAQGGADARTGAQERDGRGLVGTEERGAVGEVAADSERERWPEGRAESAGREGGGVPLGHLAAPADADRAGREAERSERGRGREEPAHDVGDDAPLEWGVYAPAVQRWEAILGRPAPRPTDDRGRLAPEFVEWMMGFPAGWTEGVSRTARLRMLGNAVQVQVAEVVGAWLYETTREQAAA